MEDPQEDPIIDIEPGEYWETDRGAPVLGSNGRDFIIYAVVGFVVIWPVSWAIEALWTLLGIQ